MRIALTARSPEPRVIEPKDARRPELDERTLAFANALAGALAILTPRKPAPVPSAGGGEVPEREPRPTPEPRAARGRPEVLESAEIDRAELDRTDREALEHEELGHARGRACGRELDSGRERGARDDDRDRRDRDETEAGAPAREAAEAAPEGSASAEAPAPEVPSIGDLDPTAMMAPDAPATPAPEVPVALDAELTVQGEVPLDQPIERGRWWLDVIETDLAIVRLEDPELGSVSIQVHRDERGVALEMLAGSVATAIALRGVEADLRASFKARGAELRSIRVVTRFSRDSEPPQQEEEE